MWNTTLSVSMLHSLPPLFGKTDSSTPNHWLIYKLTCRNAQTNIFQRFKIATGYTLIPTNSLLLSLHINWIKYRNTPNNYTKNLMCKKDNLTAQKIFWTWPDLSDRVPVLSKKKKKDNESLSRNAGKFRPVSDPGFVHWAWTKSLNARTITATSECFPVRISEWKGLHIQSRNHSWFLKAINCHTTTICTSTLDSIS